MLSRDEILVALTKDNITVAAMLRRLRSYSITGLNITESRHVPAKDVIVKEEDVELLRALAVWSWPREEADRSSVGPLVLASFRLGPRHLAKWSDAPLTLLPRTGWRAKFDLRELRLHTCTGVEATLLARNLEISRPQWIYGELSPAHLVKASSQLGHQLNEILKICDKLAPLGVTVAKRKAYPEDLQTIEFYALDHADAPGQLFTPLQLVIVAGRAGISVGTARAALARLEESGLIARPVLSGDLDFTPEETHLAFIESALRGRYTQIAQNGNS